MTKYRYTVWNPDCEEVVTSPDGSISYRTFWNVKTLKEAKKIAREKGRESRIYEIIRDKRGESWLFLL